VAIPKFKIKNNSLHYFLIYTQSIEVGGRSKREKGKNRFQPFVQSIVAKVDDPKN